MISAVRKGRTPAALLLNILGICALGVLVYIAWNTDYTLIWREMQFLPRELLLQLVVLQIATQLALNYQWFRLCRVLGLNASFGSLLVVNAYGTVVDAANPGEKVGGEVARVLQLRHLLGFSAHQATSLVTIQKSLSLSALLILGGLALFVLGDAVAVRWIVLPLLVGLGAALVYALLFTQHLNQRVQGWRSEGRIARWLKRWTASFARDTQAIGRKPGEWALQFLLSLAIWTLFPLKLQLIVAQYGRVSALLLFAITFVSYFAAMIPLLPGGLGTFEATMSGLLAAAGLGWQQAVAISLVFRFITFWLVVLLSVLLIIGAALLRWVRRNGYES